MLSWLKTQFKWADRIRNSRPWFRINYSTYSLEGTKKQDGTLELEVRMAGKSTTLLLDKEIARKLTDWLNRTYPTESSNVIRLKSIRALPVSESTSNTTGSTENNPGQL